MYPNWVKLASVFFDIPAAPGYNLAVIARSRFRRNLLLSGLAGLLVAAAPTALAVWLVSSQMFKPPLRHPLVTLICVLVFGGFSLAEIPLMVFTMRRLVAERRKNHGFAIGLNGLYVFFAAVYGIPVMLLTGDLGWGLVLCALSIARLVASLVFVREPEAPE